MAIHVQCVINLTQIWNRALFFKSGCVPKTSFLDFSFQYVFDFDEKII